MLKLPDWDVIRSSEQYTMLLVMYEMERTEFLYGVKASSPPDTFKDLQEIANETRSGCEISKEVDRFVDDLKGFSTKDSIVRQLPYWDGFLTLLIPNSAAFTLEAWRSLEIMQHAENN